MMNRKKVMTPRQRVCVIAVLLGLFAWPSNSFAEVRFSNALVKDISMTYGFYVGQRYALNEISKKYPSLSKFVSIAELEFSNNFQSSIERMDALMSKHSKNEWTKIKSQIIKQIASYINIDQMSELQARQSIDLVRQRAKGNIQSPFIETLLIFKPGYEEHPERELIDGYKYNYTTKGLGKARGVAFSLEVPKTWAAQEGNRPHIVQKFVSENGRGAGLLMILIKKIPLQPNHKVTYKDVADMLIPNNIKNSLPAGATYINSGPLALEALPGYWVHLKMDMSRMRTSIRMEMIMYTVFYKNKMIQIQGQVATAINGNPIAQGKFKRYEKLFDLIANSLVITNLYK